MSANFGRGLHAAPGRAVSASAYDRYLGRWSRLSVPDLLGAAEVVRGHRVLDVATGTGEAAAMSIPIVGDTGFVVGADISLAMVTSARIRLDAPLFSPINADGQSLPLETAPSMPSCASLVYSSSLIRPRAFQSSGASSEPAGWWQLASTPHPTGCRCGAIFAMHWIGFFRKNNVLFWSCHGRLPIGNRLDGLFRTAGFRDVRVEQIRRQGSIDGFADYWAAIEEGVGQIPQVYQALGEADRRSVREEVHARLAEYETDGGRLTMGLEVLIASGRA